MKGVDVIFYGEFLDNFLLDMLVSYIYGNRDDIDDVFFWIVFECLVICL